MLPLGKFDVSKFALPGNGLSQTWCGEGRIRVCTHVEKHVDESLDGFSGAGKVVVEWYRASCHQISCPVCYEKAVGKMAIRIEWKFMHRKDAKYVKHVVASVPAALYSVDAKKLRVLAVSMLKVVGLHGGCVIYHPWRERCAECGSKVERIDGEHFCVECGSAFTTWIYSPHFHALGVGKVQKTKENFEISGWVVANFGVRKSIRATAHYQLSHCGIAKGFSNVVWFGSMSRGKCPPLPPEKHECPLCGDPMQKALLDPWFSHVMKSGFGNWLEEGYYFADPELFRYWDPWDGG
jgi:hypothetical protein